MAVVGWKIGQSFSRWNLILTNERLWFLRRQIEVEHAQLKVSALRNVDEQKGLRVQLHDSLKVATHLDWVKNTYGILVFIGQGDRR